jgi:hypothetical protein
MISRGQMKRQMYYGGGQGIMSLNAGAPSIKYEGDIRQQYGLGSIVKKAVKGVTGAVKDIVSSDVGKAALGVAGLYFAPALWSASPGLAGWQSGLGFAGNVLKSKLPETALGKFGAISAIGGLTGFLASQGMDEQEIESVKRNPEALKGYLRQYYMNLNPQASEQDIQSFVTQQVGEYAYAVGGRVGYEEGTDPFMERIKKVVAEIESKPEIKEEKRQMTEKEKKTLRDLIRRHQQDVVVMEQKAYGGRMKKAYGDTASMASQVEDLPLRQNKAGIKELDLRKTGGFIPPVGIKEKADDIPAMLSNNEFVFTADAVRGMGDGDVERGAEKLYNIMKTLENGGRV